MLAYDIYRRMPVAAQNLACSLYGWSERRKRFGPEFWRAYYLLLRSEAASAGEIEERQAHQLSSLVRSVTQTVPYFQHLFAKNSLTPAQVRSRTDLKKLPILSKKDVRECCLGLASRGARRQGRLIERHTSGTTGSALRFFSSPEAVAFQWAVWWRHRKRFGVEPGTPHLNFTGKPVVPADQKLPPFWRWNRPMRQALINMQQITPDKVSAIADFIAQHEFPFFSGYPSIVHAFAWIAEECGLRIERGPKHVFLGAESVQEFQREGISRVMNATITDQYGLSEGCANASRCEYGNYHEDWEFCILECVDPEVLPNGELRGRIVATGLADHGFPFIRYDTGDFGVWAPADYKCPCGRESAVLKRIEGRVEDYVLTPEGARIMRFDYLFKETESIVEAQVVQERRGEITILAVVNSGFDEGVAAALREAVARMISPSLRVNVEKVTEIPRTASGKFRPVVSKLYSAATPLSQGAS